MRKPIITRELTLQEAFNECVVFFREHENLFSNRQYEFLMSVLSYGDNISDKQKHVFIKNVINKQNCQNRKLNELMKFTAN